MVLSDPGLTILTFSRIIVCISMAIVPWGFARAQAISRLPADALIPEACPHFPVGSTIPEHKELRSRNGKLRVALKIRNSIDPNGHMRYCYIDERGNLAPTLRLHPGDKLILTLKNEISLKDPPSATSAHAGEPANRPHPEHNPCMGGAITASSTNLHFHGLSVPPVCHQDETLHTVLQPGDPPFEYRIQIPKSQPPGLYWYHPHVHGFTEEQILGGASGAIIVEGVERANPLVAGLPEHVFVIRDEKIPGPSLSDKPDVDRPTKELSINYVPVPYPKYPPAVIRMKPSERQFWRVLNAAADTYLDLRVQFDGTPQYLSLVSLDGIPLHYDQSSPQDSTLLLTSILLPPAGRAEFVLTGPPLGVSGHFMTNFVYRGAGDNDVPVVRSGNAQPGLRAGQDDLDPTRPLATLIASTDDLIHPSAVSIPSSPLQPPPTLPLSGAHPSRKRTIYFSETLVDPADPKSATLFFVTEEGHTPAVFNPHAEPNITVHQGDVEDWVIENRSLELHAFHIHQLHFLVVGALGVPWDGPILRDTINLPAWRGFGRFPSVTLRMDFRNPAIVGSIPFHCHILQHVDGGMMGTVRVEPAP